VPDDQSARGRKRWNFSFCCVRPLLYILLYWLMLAEIIPEPNHLYDNCFYRLLTLCIWFCDFMINFGLDDCCICFSVSSARATFWVKISMYTVAENLAPYMYCSRPVANNSGLVEYSGLVAYTHSRSKRSGFILLPCTTVYRKATSNSQRQVPQAHKVA